MRPVAITGIGLVCALGASAREAWPRLLAGDDGFAPISRFDASSYAARIAAEVSDAGPDDINHHDPHLRRGTRIFIRAASEAWVDSHCGEVSPSRLTGVWAGTSVSYMHMAHLLGLWRCRDEPGERVDLAREAAAPVVPHTSFLRRQGETVASAIAAALGFTGPRVTVDTACASGLHAILAAARAVARGEVPAAVAGGGAALLTPVTLLAFSRINALSTNPNPRTASRPFDRHRDGFVIGEGAAAVVLERADDARARGARVYAEILGGATSINAHSLTDPSPGGETEAATMALALRSSGVMPEQVDYVAAHGTSTPRNDAIETSAIKRVLGRHAAAILVSSHKGQLGHTLPAAGAINVVVGALAISAQAAPPTAHLEVADPECDLDYVAGTGRPARIDVALAHAFAFGGQNAVAVLRGPA